MSSTLPSTISSTEWVSSTMPSTVSSTMSSTISSTMSNTELESSTVSCTMWVSVQHYSRHNLTLTFVHILDVNIWENPAPRPPAEIFVYSNQDNHVERKGATDLKMMGGTPSDKSLSLMTFYIWCLTFEYLNIWTFEHLNIWTFEHLNMMANSGPQNKHKIWQFGFYMTNS